jgi:4-amino-4-deoxy-L-arabinose transferase-like glycosyltransferase
VPIFESPDESSHWRVSRYIHDHWRLPTFAEAYAERFHPPLYYILIAPFAADSELPVGQPTVDSQGAGIGCCSDGRLYPNRFSDLGRFGAVRSARLVSVAFSLLTVLLSYLTCLELTGRPDVAFLAGSLLGFLPQFSFRGVSVSNDAPTATLCAACLYATVCIYCRGFSWKRGITAGVLLGLAFLTKVNAICMGAALFVVLVHFREELKERLLRLGVFGISLAIVFPWLLYNQIVFGDPLALGMSRTVLAGIVVPRSLSDPYFRTTFPVAMWHSAVGEFSQMTMPMKPWMYHTIEILFAFAGLGLVNGLIRRSLDWKLLLALVATIAVNIALAIQLNLTYSQPQGRYLFPSLPCAVVLLALGIRNLLELPAFGYIGLALGVAVLNLTVLATVVIPNYWSSANEATAIDLQVSTGGWMVPAGPLTSHRTLRQTFVAGHDNLCGVEFLIATYSARLSQGTLIMILGSEDESGLRVISRDAIPVSALSDNHPVRFSFPPIPRSSGKTYVLIVSSQDLPDGQSVTAWLSGAETYPPGHLLIHDEEQPRDLFLRTFFRLPE